MNASLKRLASIIKSVSVLNEQVENRTLGVCESNSKGLRLWLALTDIGGSIPYPASVTSNIGRKLHLRDNYNNMSLATMQHLTGLNIP
jgi:hypothetical protein